jgi:malonyl CoA-acyl carrier protein transacylase
LFSQCTLPPVQMYGFSILSIVRENPLALTVHFGGRRGAAVRRNYMALEVEAPDGSGPIRLLPGITEDTPSYTFVHPAGLLFATQFTQPALVLVEKAAFDDMRETRGVLLKASLKRAECLTFY